MDISTIKNIDKIFADAAERHYQINSYGWGASWEIATKETMYPLLWVQPTDGELIKSEANDRYTSQHFTFNVKCVDLVNKNEDNERDVESDSYQILTDIVNEFNDHPYYQNSMMKLEGNVALVPLDEFSDDETTGWEAKMTIRMMNKTSFCGLPMDDIAGFSFSGPFDNSIIITDPNATGDTTFKLYAPNNYECLPAEPKSGIAYQRPMLTYQSSSWRTGDDGWQRLNGTYDYTPPTNPVSIAVLDNSFTLLRENNAFGNKNRFTDDQGTQVYANPYIIDHLTGLGWARTYFTDGTTWYIAIDNSQSKVYAGFSDWRIPNVYEQSSIYNRQGGLYMTNYSPFSVMNQNKNTYTSSTIVANSANIYYNNSVWGYIGLFAKTSSGAYYYVCRNHYN